MTTLRVRPVVGDSHTMKKLLIALSCAALLVTPTLFTTGCKTTQPAVNTTNVVRAAEIIRVVVRTGVLVDAVANTNHVALIQGSVNSLNASLKSGTITGGQLITIVASLPIDKTTIQIVAGSLLIYDSISVLFMSPESQWAIFTIASAVATGAEEGLALAKIQTAATTAAAPTAKSAPAAPAAAAATAAGAVPTPSAANTLKL